MNTMNKKIGAARVTLSPAIFSAIQDEGELIQLYPATFAASGRPIQVAVLVSPSKGIVKRLITADTIPTLAMFN